MQFLVSTGNPGRVPEFHAGLTATSGGRGGRGWVAVLSLGAALALSSCSYASDALWPSLTGKDPKNGTSAQSTQTAQAKAPSAPVRDVQPASASPRPTNLAQAPRPAPVISQAPTLPAGQMTEVGRRAVQLHDDVQKLSSSVSARTSAVQQIRAEAVQTAQSYQALVAGINARLQVGTTPGNPILQSQWNQASVALDNYGSEIGKMSELSNQVAGDAATAAFLLESTRAAYSLSGAVEEDHRALASTEDEVNRTVVSIDRLLNELSEDISRQSSYVSRERSNMTALSIAIKNGELYGHGLANRAFSLVAPSDGSPARVGVAPGGAPATASPAAAAAGGRPLVVIRFDRPNPSYEQALYTAVSRALERRPNAVFDLVAVSPGRGSQAQVALNASTAKRQAEQVLRSLTDMGLPADRIGLSASTSGSAQSNEVHLFVR